MRTIFVLIALLVLPVLTIAQDSLNNDVKIADAITFYSSVVDEKLVHFNNQTETNKICIVTDVYGSNQSTTTFTNCSDSDQNQLWYSIATIPPQNVNIIIDVSYGMKSNERLNIQKGIAVTILQSLRNFDYFNIVIYSNDVAMFSQNLMQANDANIVNALNYVDKLQTWQNETKADIGVAVMQSLNMMSNGTNSKRTSYINVMFLLTSGQYDYTVAHPQREIENSVFKPYVISYSINLTGQKSSLVPMRIACSTNGFYDNVSTIDEISEKFNQYVHFIETKFKAITVQFSNVYNDTFEDSVAISMPVYINNSFLGIVAMIVPFSVFSGNNFTFAEFNSYLEYNYTNKFSINEEMEPDCNIPDSLTEVPSIVYKNEVLFTSLAVAIAAVTLIVGFIYSNVVDCTNKCFELYITWLIIGIFIGPGFCAFLGAGLMPNIIRNTYWEQGHNVIEALNVEVYPCTQRVNCKCRDFVGSTSCLEANTYLLKHSNGPVQNMTCGVGSFCCQRQYYQCNCYSKNTGRNSYTTYCDTCSSCTKSVMNAECTMVLGKCWNFKVEYGKYYKNGDRHVSSTHKECGYNDFGCVNRTKILYAVGSSDIYYYAPYNYSLETSTLKYTPTQQFYWAIIAMITCFVVIMTIVTFYGEITSCCKNVTSCCKDVASSCECDASCCSRSTASLCKHIASLCKRISSFKTTMRNNDVQNKKITTIEIDGDFFRESEM